MDEKEKISQLNELIDELCKKDFSEDREKINLWITKLNKIYANNYRHKYSDIFSKIQTIISENNSETLEILGENLNVLGAWINLKHLDNPDDANLKNTSDSFKKFSDHINLEIGRYNFIKNYFYKNLNVNTSDGNIPDDKFQDIEPLKEEIDSLSKTIDIMRPITTQAQKQLDNLDSKLESNKISSITALTVFSAVVLAFSGGITFEAGIFKGMAHSSAYRLVFTIALTGFILFNTIFALLYLVGKLSGKSIGTKCKYYSKPNDNYSNFVQCGDGFCNKQCHSVSIGCRIFHKYSYVLFVNIILIWTMYIDFFLWIFRNQLINPIHICVQLIPIVLFISILIGNKMYTNIKINRMKLKFKIGVVKEIVSPRDNEGTIMSYVARALSSFLGKKSISQQFVKSIENDDFKAAMKKLDIIADEAIFINKDLCPFISHMEHRINKKLWKDLENEFSEFLENK